MTASQLALSQGPHTAARPRAGLLAHIVLLLLLGIAPAAPARGAGREQNTQTLYLPNVVASGAHVIIAAAHIDSAVSYEPDEAVLLWNIGGRPQSLAGWQLSTASRRATFPVTTTLTLQPDERLWCAAEDTAFERSFGHAPACAWDSAARPGTVLLAGVLPLTNRGGHIHLRNEHGKLVDALLYGDAVHAIEGWNGAPAQVYTRGAIGAEGQVWRRKLHRVSDQPLDSDRAADWAGDLADIDWGRRVFFPGWNAETLRRPVHVAGPASITVAVAPEGLFAPLHAALASAQHAIDLSLYVLEHPELANTIADAAQRGVRVRLLLEGSPVGGVTDLQRWCVSLIAAAGADVRYMAVTGDAPNGYQTRYRYAHAKYGVVDGRTSLVGTENLTWDAAPVSTGTPIGGRRGFFLLADSPAVARALASVFEADWQPDRFLDLTPYDATHPIYGDPPPGYVLPPPPEFPVDSAPFARPVTATGPASFLLITAPENALRPDDGLHALIDRAGLGDQIFVAQLYEHKTWGSADSNPVADPNPRLERLIDAARRGARVRLLLDSLFDEPEDARSNRATADYVNVIAAAEGLDLQARLCNPTGGGLHAKLVLVRVGGETWSAVGSLNGGEVSYKVNREVVLMTDMPAVHERLAEVFHWDWAHTP